ncbi:hypothetical protein RM96_28270 [Cupriavidus sp. IDO]|nr:hypothetical protein RM96_28270 [Cupriavidus sp. IDO]
MPPKLQAAVPLWSEIDTGLRREHIVVGRDLRLVKGCVDGMRASGHAGPEPKFKVLQRIEPLAQHHQLFELLRMGHHIHPWLPYSSRAVMVPL